MRARHALISAMRAAWMASGSAGVPASASSLSQRRHQHLRGKRRIVLRASPARRRWRRDRSCPALGALPAAAASAMSSSNSVASTCAGFPAVEGVGVVAHQLGARLRGSSGALKCAGAEKPRPSESSGSSARPRTRSAAGASVSSSTRSSGPVAFSPSSVIGSAPGLAHQAQRAPECASASCPAGRAWAPAFASASAHSVFFVASYSPLRLDRRRAGLRDTTGGTASDRARRHPRNISPSPRPWRLRRHGARNTDRSPCGSLPRPTSVCSMRITSAPFS